jgi:MFS family permease
MSRDEDVPGIGGVLRRTLRSGPLRRALVAYLVFNTAEWATYVALLVWAFDQGGAGAAGAIALVQLVPAAIVAPLGSVIGDRMRRSHALALGYALQAVTLLATAVALSADATFSVVAVAAATSTCAISLTRPVHHALIPDLAGSPAELAAGNSASTTVEGVAGFVGPAVSGLMLAAWGAASVFALFGVLSVATALLTVGLAVRGRVVRAGRERLLGSAFGGFREVSADAGAALLVAMVAAQYVVVGLLDILTVVLAFDVLGLGDAGPGLLTSALGAGAVLGASASLALVGRRTLAPALAIGIALTGLPLVLIAGVEVPWAAFALLAASAVGKAFFDVAGRTLLQRSIPAAVLSRIFGVQEAVMMAGIAVGSLAAPFAVAAFGPRGAFLVAGIALPITGLLAWFWIRRLDARALRPGPKYAALAALPAFAALPQRALEQLSWSTREVRIQAGQEVIREGDEGDLFYVVLEGSLLVTQGGRELRTLGAGTGFGEIALMRDTPRTATVTAITDVELGAVDRNDFLLAVTGLPAARSSAEGVVDRYLAEDESG